MVEGQKIPSNQQKPTSQVGRFSSFYHPFLSCYLSLYSIPNKKTSALGMKKIVTGPKNL
jgi:hypothetical protein